MKILIDTMLPSEWFDRLAEHELVPDTVLYSGNNCCCDADVLTTNCRV